MSSVLWTFPSSFSSQDMNFMHFAYLRFTRWTIEKERERRKEGHSDNKLHWCDDMYAWLRYLNRGRKIRRVRVTIIIDNSPICLLWMNACMLADEVIEFWCVRSWSIRRIVTKVVITCLEPVRTLFILSRRGGSTTGRMPVVSERVKIMFGESLWMSKSIHEGKASSCYLILTSIALLWRWSEWKNFRFWCHQQN